ncbi:hypothetical protein TL16_g04669 [Triparma laevis f. inornata]|uniref:PA14 domain-containing protein n=1 Tax=Triparma laevis f. inornata TaxID=1714386 RepID=A0A9W7E429_9STRA|nr:hypothetical protein TL16_g04669 [Triparma laevis f. inornata]
MLPSLRESLSYAILLLSLPKTQADKIIYEKWDEISGLSVSDLISNTAYPDSPTSRSFLDDDYFEAPSNAGDNYGCRLTGLSLAPESGDYVLVMASDDAGQLLLNGDVIASHTSYTGSREWTKYSSQTSAAISLSAGSAYNLVGLMKEGTVEYFDKPPSIIISDMCSDQSESEGIYELTQDAASNKWIYRNENNMFINEIFASFLLMTFLILPSASIQIFSTFACREFDSAYGRFLKVDYSINSNDPTHKAYAIYAGVMVLVYPIGIPLLYWWQLKEAQSKMLLDPGQHDLIGKKARKRQNVEGQEWEFVLVNTLTDEVGEDTSEKAKVKIELSKAKANVWTERGLMIALGAPKLEPEPQDEEGAWTGWEIAESLTDHEAMHCAVCIRSKNAEEHPTMTRISSLYAMYEPQCYDFEVKETLRKLLFTRGIIFFKPGSASQIVISI